MSYSNFFTKVDWNVCEGNYRCAFSGALSDCYLVEFTYYCGKSRHSEEYLLSSKLCIDIEMGKIASQEVLETIKEIEVLG